MNKSLFFIVPSAVILLMLGACTSTKTTTQVAHATLQATPFVNIGSSQELVDDNLIVVVAKGQKISLWADPTPAEASFRWTWTGNGGLTSETEPTIQYLTPPSVEVEEEVTITVTVTDLVTGRTATDRVVIRLLPPPTETPVVMPTPVASAAIPPTSIPPTKPPSPPTVSGPLSIVSLSPDPATCTQGGQCIVSVKVHWDGTGGTYLYILILPVPSDSNQLWWVQTLPTRNADNWISSPVYIGQTGDAAGLPFEVCAIATNEVLSRGQSWPQHVVEGWEKMQDCRDITRGQ
jgi:hypothetical protein